MMESTNSGLVQAYTGDGKGKTTAAIGLAIRAVGAGMSVSILQFMKEGGPTLSSEVPILKELPNVQLRQYGQSFIYSPKPSRDEVQARIGVGLVEAARQLSDGVTDLLILDEILVAIDHGLADEGMVAELIESRPSNVEIVLTGRGLSNRIADLCDLVTEMLPVKHPYEAGQKARRGIEY